MHCGTCGQGVPSSPATDGSSSESDVQLKPKKKSSKSKRVKMAGKHSKSKKIQISSSSASSDEGEDNTFHETCSSEDESAREKPSKKSSKSKKRKVRGKDGKDRQFLGEWTVDGGEDEAAVLRQQIADLTTRVLNLGAPSIEASKKSRKKHGEADKIMERGEALDYKRVDQVWDKTLHMFKVKESAVERPDEFEQYIFTVRRRFDFDNKYLSTIVDVKSKFLAEVLREVMKEAKSVALDVDTPEVDPNMLFLYIDQLRAHIQTLRARAKAARRSRDRKKFDFMKSAAKVLIKYLDKDFAATRKSLQPMLKAGNITYTLLWALFKPGTIAHTLTYGNTDEPRCFKVDSAWYETHPTRGAYLLVQGQYLEYDGKAFGYCDCAVEIDGFRGQRGISSLSVFPLRFHEKPDEVKKLVIERGKKFVALQGMNYKFHQGMSFFRKKHATAKINTNGRIMIDPASFRRINPNYHFSRLRRKQGDLDHYGSDDDAASSYDRDSASSDDGGEGGTDEDPGLRDTQDGGPARRYVLVKDENGTTRLLPAPTEQHTAQPEMAEESLAVAAADGDDDKYTHEFTDDELLIASSVALGFSFSDKLWLEFSVSGIREVDWNEDAFPSLVLPESQKTIVRALVESHKFHRAKTIDDVVQGKGRGLVAVLHGPPGTGKTLTAEGIAELLRCPLYMVSTGELGTDPRTLERELQQILDIAHSWGAVLLLDEADIFLEARSVRDIHRNALVSVFLRLLEYFPGILFLTTNRVETFDEAFQSRIHIALRYEELTSKARRAVWKIFLDRVVDMEKKMLEDGSKKDAGEETPDKIEVEATVKKAALTVNGVKAIEFDGGDLDALAKKKMNGRQIKNAVKTAQALAVNEGQSLSMHHIRRVLEVADSFEKDLKGGSGYDDAMKSYM